MTGSSRWSWTRSEPMIALPFHPSNAYTIQEFQENLDELLHQVDEDSGAPCSQAHENRPASLRQKIRGRPNSMWIRAVIAGCSGGTYQNIVRAAEILEGHSIGYGAFWLSASIPASQPSHLELLDPGGAISPISWPPAPLSAPASAAPASARATCPPTAAFSIRHTTRNFPNREGSKPADGQVVLRGPRWTPGPSPPPPLNERRAHRRRRAACTPGRPSRRCTIAYDDTAYRARVYYGVGQA
ncbi:MAG: hypothetical protein ACLRWQ_06860 [Flavonifractor plautii]